MIKGTQSYPVTLRLGWKTFFESEKVIQCKDPSIFTYVSTNQADSPVIIPAIKVQERKTEIDR